eukprot:CAMPEP_0194188424 /NCGR_PEP_ID=MMETSP0154-20130528/54972_1 /TAXON_ID=1049557 /ORGANISM="Thalassiothrix antarctica, Strain L6-D1" /LENGTH=147 /DNA_ID=CAMNT_0038908837 /DNA_START=67 /DNA_END=507 /DNA_ORIENTATION=+
MDDENNDNFTSKRFLMSTGILMILMGMAYIGLPIDLLPDFIPLIGNLDNMLARMVGGAGFMMCYLGYLFGTGDTPKELEQIVNITRIAYDTLILIWNETLLPILIPYIKAIMVPIKAGTAALLNYAIKRASSVDVTAKVLNTIIQEA